MSVVGARAVSAAANYLVNDRSSSPAAPGGEQPEPPCPDMRCWQASCWVPTTASCGSARCHCTYRWCPPVGHRAGPVRRQLRGPAHPGVQGGPNTHHALHPRAGEGRGRSANWMCASADDAAADGVGHLGEVFLPAGGGSGYVGDGVAHIPRVLSAWKAMFASWPDNTEFSWAITPGTLRWMWSTRTPWRGGVLTSGRLDAHGGEPRSMYSCSLLAT